MSRIRTFSAVLVAATAAFGSAGCSTLKGGVSASDLSEPLLVSYRASPDTPASMTELDGFASTTGFTGRTSSGNLFSDKQPALLFKDNFIVHPDHVAALSRGSGTNVHEKLIEIRDHIMRSNFEAPYPEIPLYILAHPDAEPLASSMGEIYIPLSTIEALQFEDQLAFVIAHEIAHVLKNHFTRMEDVRFKNQLIEYGTALTLLGIGIAETRLNDSGGQFKFELANSGAGKDAATKSMIAGIAASEAINILLEPRWTRRQEDEADLMAADMLINAGYDPYQGITALTQLAVDKEDKYDRLATALDALPQLLVQSGVKAVADGGFDTGTLIQFGGMAALMAYVDFRENELNNFHNIATERQTNTQEYLDVFYDNGLKFEEHIDWERRSGSIDTRISSDAAYKTLIEHYTKVREAEVAVEEGDLSKIDDVGNELVSGVFGADAYSRYVMFLVRDMQGDSSRAAQNLKIALDNAPFKTPRMYHRLATYHMARGEESAAIAVLDAADVNLGTPFATMPLRMRILGANENWEGIVALNEECQKIAVDEITKQCADYAQVAQANIQGSNQSLPVQEQQEDEGQMNWRSLLGGLGS